MRKKQKPSPGVGDLIKQTRKSMGMTQMQLADKIGVSYQQIQKYEKGTSQLTIERLKQFAKALEISPHAFIEDSHGKGSVSYKGLGAKEIKLVTLFKKIKAKKLQDSLISMFEYMVVAQR